jgi:surface polysaccharide O-acyltransferase-like enzyme
MNSKDMNEIQILSNINHLKKDDKNNYQTIKRNYGIDLLRIISMINIINLHINLFSGQLSLNYTSPKFYSIWRSEVFSFCAVDCFGLISGIVGYKRYKFSNLIYILIQLCFYSTSISLFLFIKNQINIKDLFLSLFPILIKRHWYINAYFSMYLLLPFINHGINSLNRKIYKNLIIFFIFFFSFHNFIAIIFGDNNCHFLLNGYSSMWLTILYIIGAFYGKYILINKNTIDIISFILYILIYISCSFLSSEIKFKLIKKKSEKPDISIIITVHNLAHCIHKCIRSIQNQSIGNLEMIIVDDCSRDNITELIE